MTKNNFKANMLEPLKKIAVVQVYLYRWNGKPYSAGK